MTTKDEFVKGEEGLFHAREPTLEELAMLAATGRFPDGFADLPPEKLNEMNGQLAIGKLSAAALLGAPAILAGGGAGAGGLAAAGKGIAMAPLRAISAGFSGMIGLIIGQNVNTVMSMLGISGAKIKTAQEWLAFTTPAFNPEKGAWEFPAQSDERLRKRMREAGMTETDIDLQVTLLEDNRRAMANLIKDVGLPGTDFEVIPGETELEAAKRVAKEKVATRKKDEESALEAAQRFESAVQARQQAGAPRFTGSPAQQTEQALNDPILREIKRRQGVTLPKEIQEAPVEVSQPLLGREEGIEQRRFNQAEQRRLEAEAQMRTNTPVNEQRLDTVAPPQPAQPSPMIQPQPEITLPKFPETPGTQPITGGVNTALNEIMRRKILARRGA